MPLLLDVFHDHHLAQHPSHKVYTWVDVKGRETATLTYLELWEHSSAVAEMLTNHPDIQAGDRVMIAYPFGLDFLGALLGCMRAGVIACSVYPPSPTKLKTDLPVFYKKVADAGAKFTLSNTLLRRVMMAETFVHIDDKPSIEWLVTDKLEPVERPRSQDFKASPDDTAFIQYTSGSTGFPKGVMISHRSLIGNCEQINLLCTGTNAYDGHSFDIPAVNWVPQYHDLGLIGAFLTALYGGWRLHAMSPLDFIQQPFAWHNMIINYKAQLTTGPNFAFGLMIKRITERLQSNNKKYATLVDEKWSTLQSVILGAEPADPKVIRNMHSVLGIPQKAILNAYGMAETGAFVSCGQARIHEGVSACGPVNGYSTIVLVKQRTLEEEVDNERADREILTEEGVVGEIWVKSSLSASGYWGQKELSMATFCNKLPGHDGDWLATGDLGRVDNGELFVTGRQKELIILNGKNYFPVDLERVVESSFPKQIRPGCTVAYQHSPTEVGMVMELRKGVKPQEAPTPASIRQAVSGETNVGLQHILILKDHTVPKTTSGKLRRKETRGRCLKGSDGWPQEKIILHWHHKQKKPLPLNKPKSVVDLLDESMDMSEVSDDSLKKPEMDRTDITREHKRIRRILQDHIGGIIKYDNLVSDLGLTSVEMTSLKSTLEQELGIEDDAIQVSWFFEGEQTIMRLMDRIIEVAEACKVGSSESRIRQPYVPPLPVYIVSFFLQAFAAVIPPLYLGAASLPGFFFFKFVLVHTNIWIALGLSPLYMFGVLVQSGILLVVLKWLLVGKQKPEKEGGFQAVWSFPFASRWIVRQCCRLSWKYTPWGALSDTELLNVLHRFLGTKVGRGVEIKVGRIEDFDLVAIGDGSSVQGFINTDEIALGVQVFSFVEIGNNCSIGSDAYIGRGTVLEDDVIVKTKSMVPSNSLLPQGTRWHGIPVQPNNDEPSTMPTDIENPKGEKDPLLHSTRASLNSSTPYALTQLLTVFVLSPYLFSVEFTVTFAIWTIIRMKLGWAGLAPLVWAAPTASWLIMLWLSVMLKHLLLGTVRPQRWKQFGFFHCSKYVVDHLVIEHMYRWHTYAQLFGCPFADSMMVRRFIFWLLGAKIGQKVMFCDTPSGLTAYDLLTVHDGTMWGGGASVDVFRTTDDGYLVGEEVIVGRNAYLGGLSKLLPGTIIQDGGAVATATVASGIIHSNELFMGTSKQRRRDQRSSSVSYRELMHFEAGCALGSFMLGSGSAVTIAILYHLSIFLSNRIWYSALPDSSALIQSCAWSAMISIVVGLGLPMLSTAVIVVSKTLLVGQFKVGSTPRSDPKNIPLVAFTWTILRFSRELGREMSSGTWMELWYNRALGANIGNHVYLDGAYLFEHDLIQIGDYSTIRESGLSGHQVGVDVVELAPIYIGERCSMNFASCVHGRDSMEDDTTLEMFGQPVIGTRMNGGRWMGYPAKKVAPTSLVPPRPQDPVWYISAMYPVSTIGMLLWTAFVVMDHYIFGFGKRSSMAWFRQREEDDVDSAFLSIDMPACFQGVWASDDTMGRAPLYLRLDSGDWIPDLRLLRWNAGTYFEAQGVRRSGIFWWDWVSYDWHFEASKRSAVGKLRLGGWQIPAPILEGHLERSSNGGWALSHKWFRRDAAFLRRFFTLES